MIKSKMVESKSKSTLKFFIVILFFNLVFTTSIFAEENIVKENMGEGLTYSRSTENNHVIHILTIDPKVFRFELVKAHNQTFGRETVESIAKRKNAIASINGGFFEIGESDDGRPSGTLIINGQWIALAKGERSLLSLSDKEIKLGNAEMKIKLVINDHSLQPDKVNQYAKDKEIVLYNSHFGSTTLTAYDRKEILINPDYIVQEIMDHGDNAIPPSGFILSVPKTFDTSFVKLGQKITVDLSVHSKAEAFNNTHKHKDLVQNIIMGIPLLVKSGQSMVSLSKSQNSKEFTEQAHARSAFGIKSDGKIVWVVVEHHYKQPISKVTISEIQDLLKKKGYSKKEMDEMTFASINPIVREHFSHGSTIGLNLSELADFMIGLGCIEAINLDGGGSSTLYLNGKVVNSTIGDKDEGMSKLKQRPVADAIVILKR